MLFNCILVAVGGAIGAVSRYLVSTAAITVFQTRFALGTLAVNLAGCFLIGIASEFVASTLWGQEMKLFFITGFLGGLTTFSSYSLEAVTLFSQGRIGLSVFTFGIHNAAGFLATALGMMIARR